MHPDDGASHCWAGAVEMIAVESSRMKRFFMVMIGCDSVSALLGALLILFFRSRDETTTAFLPMIAHQSVTSPILLSPSCLKNC